VKHLRAVPFQILFLFSSWELLFPGRVEALQMHPPSEGLLVHQITHFLFALSMGVFIYWLRQRALIQKAPWRSIQYSAFFFIIWNINDMIIHHLDNSAALFERAGVSAWRGWIQSAEASDWLTGLYYLGKMDHLLCVPAVVFLYIGLKKLLDEVRLSHSPEVGS
jgi:hypothetical protein